MKKFILFLIMQCFITTALFSVMLDHQPLELPLPQGDYFSPQPEQDQPQDDTDPILQLAHHICEALSPEAVQKICNQLVLYIANHPPHADVETASADSPRHDILPSEQKFFDTIINHYAYNDLCHLYLCLTQESDQPQQDAVFQDDGQDAYYETAETEEDDFPLLIFPDETTKLLNSSKTPSPLPESPNLPPQSVHPHKKNQSKTYKCPDCNHPPFSRASNLNVHIKTKHEGKTYQCPHCKHRPFTSTSGLSNHVQTKHTKKTYQCPHCTNRPFSDASGLRKHIKSFHDKKTYQCPHCTHSPFAYSASLHRHVQTKHEKKNYQCLHPNCSHKSFTNLSSLYRHIESVHDKICHKCPNPKCNARFTQKSSLTRHRKKKHLE